MNDHEGHSRIQVIMIATKLSLQLSYLAMCVTYDACIINKSSTFIGSSKHLQLSHVTTGHWATFLVYLWNNLQYIY